MERRVFLKLPLVSAFLGTGLLAIPSFAERPKKGVVVRAGEDRFGEEFLFMGGEFFLKVSAKDTDNDLCIYDTFRYEKGGPGLHLHHKQDEWFYVTKGVFKIRIGEEEFILNPGDSAFAPRGIPHAFANVSEGEAQLMVLLQPAGTFETFIKILANVAAKKPGFEQINPNELAKAHDIEMLGPPLTLDL